MSRACCEAVPAIRVAAEVRGTNRVVYDVTSIPPRTIERE
jgi:GMP synthase PP-ATPase subunit